MKISLRRRHALMVEDGAFSHKIYYITIFKETLNLKGDQNHITGIFAGWVVFAYLWSFISEGSASADCLEKIHCLLHLSLTFSLPKPT